MKRALTNTNNGRHKRMAGRCAKNRPTQCDLSGSSLLRRHYSFSRTRWLLDTTATGLSGRFVWRKFRRGHAAPRPARKPRGKINPCSAVAFFGTLSAALGKSDCSFLSIFISDLVSLFRGAIANETYVVKKSSWLNGNHKRDEIVEKARHRLIQ